jgi:dTDP-4-amino-4,6-dideoxygalactose transaminase
MTANPILESIEKRVAEYIGTRHAVVCSSARNAIRFSLLALGVGHEDEVVIPDFACKILPITVFCTGARPRFCDVDKRTCAITSASLRTAVGPRTKAAIFIHPLGIPADVSAVMEFAKKMNISLVEDAAQSLGASINHRKTGSLGHVGVLSFNKFIECNLGGAAVTNDGNLADKIRAVRAEKERKALFPFLACSLMEAFKLNYRKNMKRLLWADGKIVRWSERTFTKKYILHDGALTAIDSYILRMWRDNALTCAMINQLMAYGGTYWHRRKMEDAELLLLNSEFENLEISLQYRRRIAKDYDELLKDNGIDKMPAILKSEPSYLRYPILVHDGNRLDKLQKAFKNMGFNVQDYRYRPLHLSSIFGFLNGYANFPNSTYVSEHILTLPIFSGLSRELIARMASIVNAEKTLD